MTDKRGTICCQIPVFCLMLLLASCAATNQATSFSFAEGQWQPGVWTLVKSSRWDHFGRWVQRSTHIENEVPPDATAESMLGPRAAETYTSMVLTRKVRSPATISATMAFTHRMAPLIVIAPQLGTDAAGRPEYREHFEVVIHDQGANIWHHSFTDGKPSWVKAADAKFPLQPNVKYHLKIEIVPLAGGKRMSVFVAGHTIEYEADALPDEFHVGITGCEGINRFYDFDVRTK